MPSAGGADAKGDGGGAVPAAGQGVPATARSFADSATMLVRETVRRDARGDWLYPSDDPRWQWFFEVVTDPDEEIAWDNFDAIWRYDIAAGIARGDTVDVTVTYGVIGLVGPVFENDTLVGCELHPVKDTVRTWVYQVVHTSHGVKIVSELPEQRVLASALLKMPYYRMVSRADSLILERWAAREPRKP